MPTHAPILTPCGPRRQDFLSEMQRGGDPVLAALHLASEDDAVTSRSTVPLPVESFSKRLDSLISRAQHPLRQCGADAVAPEQALELLQRMLFDDFGFRAATHQLDLFSPYRVYMHKVLTQRCGTPAALAALLAAFVRRAQHGGLVKRFDVLLGIPGPGQLPRARVAGDGSGHAAQGGDEEGGLRCAPPASCLGTAQLAGRRGCSDVLDVHLSMRSVKQRHNRGNRCMFAHAWRRLAVQVVQRHGVRGRVPAAAQAQ